MTGFARQSSESELATLTWELRSVNHRYLDVQFRLPDEFRPREAAFKQQVAAVLGRGKVECALHVRKAMNPESDLTINMDLVALLRKRVTQMQTALHETAPMNAIEILRWPGVVVETALDTKPLYVQADALLEATLAAMAEMRASEGSRIAEMLESRCADIAAIGAGVRERMPEVLTGVRRKQRERLDKLDIEADPERLEVELALVAQKLDVDEELDRLDSHLVEIRAALGKTEPVGRRLDFLMQELNREANTLGSKSADAQTTKAAVDLKVLIEQMREQIQNIE